MVVCQCVSVFRLEPRGRQTNVIDRPRAKTTEGESPQWGKGHGDKYGDHMVSILKEIMDFGSDKKGSRHDSP